MRDHALPTVSPDGRTVVYGLTEEETGTNLYARPLGGGEPQAVRTSRGEENFPAFSPDGRWLAYQSDETGRPEIYVEAFPGPGERIQISADGGREPRWAANGELFFRHDDELRVVAIRTGPHRVSTRRVRSFASQSNSPRAAASTPGSTTSPPTASGSSPSRFPRRCGHSRSTSSPIGRPSSRGWRRGAGREHQQRGRPMIGAA